MSKNYSSMKADALRAECKARKLRGYSGLTKEQMQRLRQEFGIYGVDSGRICVAALNSKNIDAVVSAIAKVV